MLFRKSKINLAQISLEDREQLKVLLNKEDRVLGLKEKYKEDKIPKKDLEEAHRFLNKGAENYIDIDLMTEENKRTIEHGIEECSIYNVLGYNYLIDGLTIHNEDIFIYLTIKTDEEDYIVEITEKYLFSASLINEAIKNTKGEKAYYRHLETGGQIYE